MNNPNAILWCLVAVAALLLAASVVLTVCWRRLGRRLSRLGELCRHLPWRSYVLTETGRVLLDMEAVASGRPGCQRAAEIPDLNHAALMAALSAGRLGGACLDVQAREPLPSDSPLRSSR